MKVKAAMFRHCLKKSGNTESSENNTVRVVQYSHIRLDDKRVTATLKKKLMGRFKEEND